MKKRIDTNNKQNMCKGCRHNGYIMLENGKKLNACYKLAPNYDEDLQFCMDYEEKKIEPIQLSLF